MDIPHVSGLKKKLLRTSYSVRISANQVLDEIIRKMLGTTPVSDYIFKDPLTKLSKGPLTKFSTGPLAKLTNELSSSDI